MTFADGKRKVSPSIVSSPHSCCQCQPEEEGGRKSYGSAGLIALLSHGKVFPCPT